MRTPTPSTQLKCRICGFDRNRIEAKRCLACDVLLGPASVWDFLPSPLGILGIIGSFALGVFGWGSFSSLNSNFSSQASPVKLQVTSSADSWAGYFWLRQGTDPNSVFGKILHDKGIIPDLSL